MAKKSRKKFAKGDLIFGKVRGYQPWPAVVTDLGHRDKYDNRFKVDDNVCQGSLFYIISGETSREKTPIFS